MSFEEFLQWKAEKAKFTEQEKQAETEKSDTKIDDSVIGSQ